MGYVKDIDMIAYLTQKGKEHFFSGKKLNIRITHFSIADPDTNYLVASKTIYNTLGEKNILQKNFVPNISGVYGSEDNCLKYVSDGIGQKYTLYGGCPDVGEYINSDLSVTCEKPIPSNLLLETKTFVNGQIKDNFAISYVTNDQDSSGLEQTDYVFTKVKRELNKNTTARFDLDFNYQLLDENGFRKTSPNGYEIFNIIFNSFDTNIFKIENTLYYENNNFISNPLNLQSTNKFMLLKTENIDETYGGNFFYVKDINVEDFLKLPQYGWNTVADMHVEIINGIDTIIVPIDPITKIQKNLNKKIRFYKPTTISLKQNSALSTDGKTLDLGTKKSNINTITTFTFFINFDIYLNSNSPEGKEIAYLNIYGNNNLDLKFKNFDTKIVFNKGELVKTFNNVEVELTIDSTNLFDPIQGQFNLFISNVNDYVLVNSDQISYTFNYKSNKQYKVTTNSNPNNTYGTVTGAGTYNEGDTVTIIATPNTDYRFIKLEEKTNNQLTNTYTSPTRTFNIANDIDFTGYFELIPVIPPTISTTSYQIDYFSFYNGAINDTTKYYPIIPNELPKLISDSRVFEYTNNGNLLSIGFTNSSNRRFNVKIDYTNPEYTKYGLFITLNKANNINEKIILGVVFYGEYDFDIKYNPTDTIQYAPNNTFLVIKLYKKGNNGIDTLVGTGKMDVKNKNSYGENIILIDYIEVYESETYYITASSENNSLLLAHYIKNKFRAQIGISVASVPK